MKKATEVLPELIIATLAASLWFTPKDLAVANVAIGKLLRATGYSASVVFYGKSYLLLALNYSKFQLTEVKEAVDESIEQELYEFKKEQQLHIRKLQIEAEAMEQLQPVFIKMRSLEEESEPENVHPELSEEQKLNAARNAVEAAIAPTVVQPKFSEEEIRQHFPSTGDSTSWKAICKALGSGYSKDEIVAQVLNCNGSNFELGKAYYSLLKDKFS